jgi:hypothetical protein
MNVNDVWKSILPDGLPPGGREHWLRLPDNSNGTGVVTLDDHDGRRVRAFVVVDDHSVTPHLVVRRMWDAINQVSDGLEGKDGRARALVGVPLPGTGDGGLSGRRGEVIDALLQQHRDDDCPCDIALVLRDRRDFAATQNRRNSSDDWSELSEELSDEADRLGDLAMRRQLSLFLGAGVSKPAGLPDWTELLHILAARADVAGPTEDESHEDAATRIREALGDDYHEVITELLDAPRHAVGHALLASLRVPQMVTTNFDPCLELALDPVLERRYRVLARELAGDSMPWLLKLNGDIKEPASVVLTGPDFKRHHSDSQALQGVVQALLLTSHLLFVGYSMKEESFLKLANEVTRVRQRAQCPELVPTGTAIALAPRTADEPGYEDLFTVSMDASSVTEGARRLEIFLDRLCWKASSSADWAAQYLLDDDYDSGLRPNERALRNALYRFLKDVGSDVRTSPGWSRVADTLKGLGVDNDRLNHPWIERL